MARREILSSVVEELGKYVVGYSDLLRLMVVAILSEGHILIEGPPGTGKTLTARLVALSIGGVFKRIQGIPDMLPSDITGSYYFDIAKGEWIFREGPIFANVVMVDEINRMTPRTQSALLEAMQEGKVSVEGRTHQLPKPFLLIATRMNVGEEGLYQLTPNLLDRFAYSYRTSYPDAEAELKILERVDAIEDALRDTQRKPLLSPKDIAEMQSEIRSVYVSEAVRKYIVDLVNQVRGSRDLLVGPSTRASVWLLKGSRALAYLEGLDYVAPDHVKILAESVLTHRVVLRHEALLKGVRPRDLVERALREVEVAKI